MGHADSGLASGDILAATRIQPGVSTWQEVVMLSEAARTSVHEALAIRWSRRCLSNYYVRPTIAPIGMLPTLPIQTEKIQRVYLSPTHNQSV